MLLLLLILLFTFAVVYHLFCHLEKWRKLRFVPGDGTSLIPFIDVYNSMQNLKKYGDPTTADHKRRIDLSTRYRKDGIYTASVTFPWVMVFKAELAEEVLKLPQFADKSALYEMMKSWLGEGLITSNGANWKSQRRVLNPTLNSTILIDFLDTMNEHSLEEVSKMKDMMVDDEAFKLNISDWSIDYTMSLMLETTMGFKKSDKDLADRYLKYLKQVVYSISVRMATPWFSKDAIFLRTKEGENYMNALKGLDDVVNEVIARKKQMLKDEQDSFELERKKKTAFLDLMVKIHLEDGGMTVKEMKDQVHTFMFGGHDSTGWGIAWALFQIGHQPDIQRKIQEELMEVFGDDRSRHVTVGDIKSLKYLDRVIRETQRLYPSAPLISRKCVQANAKLGPYEIPKDTTVALDIFNLHYDPEIFPDPEKFDPDRFLPENCESRHPYAFLPFSAGPRNCIGQHFAAQELRVTCANILRNFRVRSLVSLSSVKVASEIILRSRDGLPVELTRID